MAGRFDRHHTESEDEAWKALAAALEEEPEQSRLTLVEFERWPFIEIYLPRTVGDSVITPIVMHSFITIQEAIYRTHTLILYDGIDLRMLSKAERDAFEFAVKVSGGSSRYNADLSEPATRLASEMVAKMESRHLLYGALGISLMFFGSSVFKEYLQTRSAERLAEITG